jgi:2-methylcitrate dehydratase
MALLDGDVSVQQFHDDRWKAPEVLALAAKVIVRVGESLVSKMPKGHGASVEVRLTNGQVLKESVEIPDGDAARPLAPPALEHKFRQFAEPVLGAAGSGRGQRYSSADRSTAGADIRAGGSQFRYSTHRRELPQG